MKPTKIGKVPEEIVKKLASEVEKGSRVGAFFSQGKYFIVLRLRREGSQWENEYEDFIKYFKGSKGQSKKDWAWWYNLMGVRAMLVMEMLYPYLTTKQENVKLCRELHERMQHKSPRGKALPPKEHEVRREILMKLKRLDKEDK